MGPPTHRRLDTIYERDQPTNEVVTRSIAICGSKPMYVVSESHKKLQKNSVYFSLSQ